MTFSADDDKEFPHLKLARLATNPSQDLRVFKEQPNCFEFANHVLRLTLSAQAFKEWDNLWQITLHLLPDSYWSAEIIPYHYFLIAGFLEGSEFCDRWQSIDPFQARTGDILIYQGIDYEPDPSKRHSPEAPDSHIAFVDSVLERDESNQRIILKLIDASSRRSGRIFSDQVSVPKKPGCIAYSFLTLDFYNSTDKGILWKATFKQQRPKTLFVRFLRVRPLLQ